jgi:hypothetical protein
MRASAALLASGCWICDGKKLFSVECVLSAGYVMARSYLVWKVY